MTPAVSIVVIGLDEGARLGRALVSALAAAARVPGGAEVIYVDSGSRDGSVARARGLAGVEVLTIDRRGASAARARNAGVARARAPLVQLLDGDMELAPDWLPGAVDALRADGVAGVAGELVEREPTRSVYTLAFGLDWKRPAGPADTLGGAALWRRDVLVALEGFDESLRVGEDPDLALRARAAGHSLVVLERRMATHDLDLGTAGAYWRRGLAVGASRANVAWKHDTELARQRLREPLVGVAIPLVGLLVAGAFEEVGLALYAAIAALVVARRAVRDRAAGHSTGAALVHAVHVHVVKVPVALGALLQLRRLARVST